MGNPFSSRQLALCTVLAAGGVLVGCGSDSGSDEPPMTEVSIGFSDAPVEDAAKVVISVDKMVFQPESGDDIVVDRFTSQELGIEDAETFQIDLLQFQGTDSRLVVDSVTLPVGEYRNLRIHVLDEDVNESFVEEVSTGEMKPIKVPSDQLKLGSFTVASTDTQSFVVEFGLRQSLVHNPTPERYILKPRGIRIVEKDTASTLSGAVDLAALHGPGSCADKLDPSKGNVAYLYEGHDLDPATLGDVFIRRDDQSGTNPGDFDPDVPNDVLAPHAVAAVDEDGEYLFSYLFSGDYTLALSCLADNDDPVIFDGIRIPAPETELIEITLGLEEDLNCDFPLAEGGCSTAAD
ncbi:DUF4382 domain-containing protein [Gilvimarinus sp. F26214L]|uniref:DUF4382 domain-containing protein n=1 Tax=Gilvimarinus sp. DZF01 TaxID=3461371 RepID=UPI00404634E5